MTTIAVIIPFYNGSGTIHSTLQSVFAQTCPPQEIIIIDDASAAQHAAALDAYADRCTIRHLAKNVGVSMARNIGIGMASSEWIAFLDHDDLWEPTKLEKQLNYIIHQPECVAVHTAIRSISLEGEEKIHRKSQLTTRHFLEIFPCAALPSAVLIKRDVLIACGLFNPTMGYAEDHELFLRVSLYHPFHYIDEPLTIRRVMPTSLSLHHMVGWDMTNRWLRYYRNCYPTQADFRKKLAEVNTTFMLRALQLREFGMLWTMFWQVTSRDVSRLTLLSGAFVRWVQNRLKRKLGTG